jgi:hypothetical protein
LEKYTTIIYDEKGVEKHKFEDCYLQKIDNDMFYSERNNKTIYYKLGIGETIVSTTVKFD